MTLTEFLLARITDDEAAARTEDYEATPHTSECGHKMNEAGYPCRCHWPARVLAECEAKRRIVAEMMNPFGDDDPRPVLRALATVYAGHEDFDPAWRTS